MGKADIIRLVETLRQRSGRKYEDVRVHWMPEVLGYELSRDEFDRRFRTQIQAIPHYRPEEVLALIYGYVGRLGDDKRCTTQEALVHRLLHE